MIYNKSYISIRMKHTNAAHQDEDKDEENKEDECQIVVGQIIDDVVAASTSVEINLQPNKIIKNKTKGAGAGGAQTNKNGLPYEELTDLKTEYTIVSTNKYYNHIKFSQCETTWVSTSQSKFFKCMDPYKKTVDKAHGCKNPDECYIDHQTKIIFILEKKFQQVSGSVCEKIQTSEFKMWQYGRTFPDFRIVYMYCLSDWFKLNCKAELEYLEQKNVPVFWGNDAQYKSKIIDFMIRSI